MSRRPGEPHAPDAAVELEGRVLPGAGLTVAERMAMEAAVPELKPRVREIVDVAREILDEEGVDAISMRAIATRLEVRAPSLYKHLPDKQAILDVLTADILHENGVVMRAAIAGTDDPVGAIFAAFRRWVLEHPERYAACMAGPLADTPLVRSAALYSGDPLRWIMRDDLDGAITFWAFAHGLVDLEIRGRLPAVYDTDVLWSWGVARLRHADDGAATPDVRAEDAAAAARRGLVPVPEPLSERAARIVDAARELLDAEGEERMSMRGIADRLDVRAPSLYKHFPDKEALEKAIIASVLDEQAALWRAASADARAAGEDPLLAIIERFRLWALEHPHLHRLVTVGPPDRGPLVASAELQASLPLLDACDGSGVAAVSVWAFACGMIDLELKDRMPPGYALDAIRRRGVGALRATPFAPAEGSDR
ncbi:TetR/AcrR family transcriptional regulator [Patulibacter minatonensis]|uniref:TetR/AcrR family transcriptional regulator n=1 Tax=Patulibacter minatonensis TaxID=298163 RepID=UPI0006852B87|nr:TetR family transcriptional regulator [Patulibacter minatonensis]